MFGRKVVGTDRNRPQAPVGTGTPLSVVNPYYLISLLLFRYLSMSSFNATCPGCHSGPWSSTGYWSHLKQSKNPLCQRAREELERVASSSDEPDVSDWEDVDSENEMDIVNPFAGDMFGTQEDYWDDNFGQSEDEHDGLEAPVGGDDEEVGEDPQQRALDLEMEEDWEPLRPGVLNPSPDSEHGRDHDSDEEREIDSAANSMDYLEDLYEEYRIAGQMADQEPRIVPYSAEHPGSQPGSVLRVDSPGDILYRQQVRGESNMWAPFASEVDWKIAKWAKLRGAGSTAFSDLLAIDGVSISDTIYSF